jgi:hypothetical protein
MVAGGTGGCGLTSIDEVGAEGASRRDWSNLVDEGPIRLAWCVPSAVYRLP